MTVVTMRAWPAMVGAVLVLGALSGGAAYESASPRSADWPRSVDWREIAWLFPRDGWPAGRAFRCGIAACGDDIEVYVRPKIGFCNCDRGVADDDEVDRVADIDLISEQFVPLRDGDVVDVADMPGRIRAYDLRLPDGAQRAAIGIAVSRRCDLLVAVAQGKGSAARVQSVALDFLGSTEMKRWMIAAMEGR